MKTAITTNVKDATAYLREKTGQKITIHELYAYIRIGELHADYVSHTFIVHMDSLQALADKINSKKRG